MKKRVVRLTTYEKKNVDHSKKYLTLFYFKHTTFKEGEIYDVVTLLKFGKKLLSGKEIEPVLLYKDFYRVKCIKVVNGVTYNDLPKGIFKYSLKTVQDVQSLKKSIKRRYLKSRPYLTNKDIETGGVAYTILELL